MKTEKLNKKTKRFVLSDHPFPWIFPLVAMLLVFTVYPLIYNVWLSFHEYAPLKRRLLYVGWDNWIKLFTDARLWESLSVTLVYFTATLIIQCALGMGIALLLQRDEKSFGFLRGLLTLTLVIPPAITGMMFLLLEDAQFGLLTYFLNLLGLLSPETPILATPSLALAGVIVADVWQWTPFMVLIFVSGLQSLPSEPYEAAMLDGASAFLVFKRITLPLLSKVISVAILIRGIDIFRMFDYVFVMTSGGPGTSTYTLSLYAWQQTFSFIKWGYGASISLFALVIILVAANLFISLTKLRW